MKIKYTIALPSKISDKLESLCIEDSMSKPEVLRRAITLYSYIHRVVDEDNKLCIVNKDNNIIKEIYLL